MEVKVLATGGADNHGRALHQLIVLVAEGFAIAVAAARIAAAIGAAVVVAVKVLAAVPAGNQIRAHERLTIGVPGRVVVPD